MDVKLQGRVGASTDGIDGEQPPGGHVVGNQQIVDPLELVEVGRVHAGDHVHHRRPAWAEQQVDGCQRSREAARAASQAVVGGLEPVEADTYRAHRRAVGTRQDLGGPQPAVGDHAPGKAQLGQPAPQREDPGVTQGLAAGDHSGDAGRVHGLGQLAGHPEGELDRQVVVLGAGGAVAAAVATGQVATLGDLEEQLAQVWRAPDGVVIHRQQAPPGAVS